MHATQVFNPDNNCGGLSWYVAIPEGSPFPGQIEFRAGSSQGGDTKYSSPPPRPNDYKERWNHWVFTRGHSYSPPLYPVGGLVNMYVNGVLCSYYSDKNFDLCNIGTVTSFRIGAEADNGVRGYKGLLDEITLYNYELKAADVTNPAPPMPNPMTFATAPYGASTTSISMTVTTATHPNSVEYYFQCTAGGGHDSGWQSGTTYNDTGLAEMTQYTYQVKAREILNLIETAYSTALPATTQAATGSAAWNLSPTSGDWNTVTNWTPATVPNGSLDTATFAVSNQGGISLSGNVEVNAIVFNAGASVFTVTASPAFFLTISGVGVTNNSGVTQNFVTAVDNVGNIGVINFMNSATAGSLTAFINNGSGIGGFGGYTQFFNTSTAGNGTFTTNGALFVLTDGGSIFFFDSSSAGNGTFTTNGGAASGARGGLTQFYDTSTAGNGTFTTNGGAVSGAVFGQLQFGSTATAGNATLIANGGLSGGAGGTIGFYSDSIGDTARVEVFGNGALDIGAHNAPGVATGSVEGSGLVFLGAKNLTVGSNNLTTTFSGVIQDGGTGGGSGGSLTKAGTGKLTLSKPSTYTGGTTITKGTLLVTNNTGSGTGTGAVQVNAGTLGGTGKIAGTVTVGTGGGSGSFLAPSAGVNRPTTLTIQSALTLKADSTYTCNLNTRKANADQVVANGVTIESGAGFNFTAVANKRLRQGQVFTLVSNTSANPIAGTFGNLPDNSTFTSGRNTFQVDYQGGDGNDLTLTVVP